ncbi:MAG: tyrosine--tRNA ligase [Planctomycetaceae bacterium]|nr:tyrosine--tRNA ligase [Planctomycetaceae bacterium]
MDIFHELTWRGLIHQATDERLGAILAEKPRTVYVGFDPTADSLHLGHFVPLMNLRRFQKAGHIPIALLGGATGMIGDPSGKSEERNLISEEVIRKNIDAIRVQMERFLDFDSAKCRAIMVNNYDWTGKFSFLEFLRDVGKHFPVNVMLAKDSVKQRLQRTDSGLSYTEFSYMLLQSYDFVHLHRTLGCELQLGGSDQWGNITAGIDLARRLDSAQLYGITFPLLTKSDGGKMGKTESGTLWLDPEKTSPYTFYQYWINLDDADVEKVLCFFTEIPEREMKELCDAHRKNPGGRSAQKRLAEELTRLIHGEYGLAIARQASEIFFGGEITRLDDSRLSSIFADVPSCLLKRSQLDEGLPLIDAVYCAKLATSKAEARRTIQQGGIYVNNKPVSDVDTKLTVADLASETILVLRSGKKRYALVQFE